MISIASRYQLFVPRCIFFSKGRLFAPKKNYSSETLLNVNTRVAKDVILYKSDNMKYFRYMNYFAISQLFFWTYLAHWAYTSLRDVPIKEDQLSEETPWWKKINFGENKYRNGITVLCLFFAYGMFSGSWAFTLRSVRYLILRKGGESVAIVTYTPFGENRIINVPIKLVSAAESRSQAKVSIPLKVQGKRLHYLLDMRGEFRNPILFDATVGLRRQLI